MIRSWHRRGLKLLLCVAAGALLAGTAAAADEFLDPQQAFRASARRIDAHTAEVRFDIAPGYHLYRDRVVVGAPTAGARLGEPVLPQGPKEFDETVGQEVEIWRGTVAVTVPVASAGADFGVPLSYQGCADKGLCYPPQTAALALTVRDGAVQNVAWLPDGLPAVAPAAAAPTAAPVAPSTGALPPSTSSAPARESVSASSGTAWSGHVDTALRSGHLLSIAGVFLVAGLLLSFTPCVLPMVPILSSIIVGRGAPVSRLRGFGLAAAYSLGMALVYTALGVTAGLLGEGLAAALQNPGVLGAFALLLVILSLSMFGLFELQMPSAVQSRLSASSAQLGGGRYLGVFVMGGLSALIVGPCVAAPLAGALVFISQTRDVLIGGLALFSLACGMSVPLLLVGLSAGSLLPRAGAWMNGVKRLFGVLLLAVALWIVAPVLPAAMVLLIIGAGLLLAAGWLLERLEPGAPGWHRLRRGVALLLMVLGVAQVAGALSGADNPLQPLARLASRGASAVDGTRTAGLEFRRVRSVAELDAILRAERRPAMLDFYADWCVSCKEMEHLTFNQSAVRARLGPALLLQADVTANSADDKALLKRFGLFGPPGILFFDAAGRERADGRVIGFMPSEAFGEALTAVGL